MKKFKFRVVIGIPDCDDWYNVASSLREIIQDRFDVDSDDEGRWHVSVEEITD